CEFWAQGKCAADTTCPFSHAGEGHALQRLPCRFFKSGSCQRGAECIWSHDLKTEPCVFHHLKQAKGGCKNGEACAFSHEPMTDQQRLVLEHEQERFEKRQSSGGCWKGPGCKFSHDPISKEEKDRL
ncbi:hypothetical protein DFJ77DRAFT_416181, partial [Powellomyces hirtus]